MTGLSTHSICLPLNVPHHTERSVQQCGIHIQLKQCNQVITRSIELNIIYCIERSRINLESISNPLIKRTGHPIVSMPPVYTIHQTGKPAVVNMDVNTNPNISATCTVTADDY